MSADMEYLQKMIRLLKSGGFGSVNDTSDSSFADTQMGTITDTTAVAATTTSTGESAAPVAAEAPVSAE